MRAAFFAVLLLWTLGPGLASADTLFLRSGKTLKIDALSCGASSCVASLAGLRQDDVVEVGATEVVKVEPDEEVEAEPSPARAVAAADARKAPGLEQMVKDAALKYALPPSLVRAVARAESALDPRAISPKGAQGVMQLMPGTARELGVKNAFDPAENIDAGARFLRQLLEKYDGRLGEALAAYNAGAGAVARHNGVPPYRETRSYIRKVVKEFEAKP